jgi:hypothetical protein
MGIWESMMTKITNEIIKAKHNWELWGVDGLPGFIKKINQLRIDAIETRLSRGYKTDDMVPPFEWNGKVDGSTNARVDYGRWVADCPFCAGAEYADPDYPVLFCMQCGMEDNGGKAVEVIFPTNWRDVELQMSELPREKQFWEGKMR